jgi:hypothetical protein
LSETDYKQGAVIALGILCGLLVLGAYVAYGEEAIINVPFQSEGLRCDFQEDSTTQTYVCIFIAEKPTGITVTQPNLTEEEVEVIEKAKHCRETGYTDPDCPEEPCIYDYEHGTCFKPDEIPEDFGGDVVENPDEPIDPRVKICAKTDLNTEEYELCRLLEAIDECYRGFGKLETIQEVSSFEVTRIEPTIWENWDLKYNVYLKKMLLAYQECRAIQTLHDDVLSAMYWDFVVDGIMDPQLNHADIPTQLPIPTQRLTEQSRLHTLGNAYESICYSSLYHESYKIQQGCPPTPIACEMVSDEVIAELSTKLVNTDQVEQYYDGSIRVYYQTVYEQCLANLSYTQLPNEDRNMDDYYLSLTPMQRLKAYQEDPVNYEKDDFLYGHVGDWKRTKGLQR